MEMQPLEEIYSGRFFRHRHKLHWRAEHICNGIVKVLGPTSLIDLGCATNDIAEYFHDYYGFGMGIEGSKEVLHYVDRHHLIMIQDLRIPISEWKFQQRGNFGLCTCFEVLEHVEEECADILVDNICHFSHQALVSAAPPGQGGHHHVNCQPYNYWIRKFAERGYYYIQSIVDQIKAEWEPWKKKDGIRAFYNNLLFFTKNATNEC